MTTINYPRVLTRLASSIAQADETRGIDESREILLKVLFDFVPGADLTISLWLIDKEAATDSQEATLWHVINSKRQRLPVGNQPMRISLSGRDIVLSSRSILKQDELKNLFGVSAQQPFIRDHLTKMIGREGYFDRYSEALLPLLPPTYAAAAEPIGLLHVVANNLDLQDCFDLDRDIPIIEATLQAIAARIVSGRRERLVSAIETFQDLLPKAQTPQELASILGQVLRDQCNAVCCTIYRPVNAHLLEKIADVSSVGGSPQTLNNETFSFSVFEAGANPTRPRIFRLSSLDEAKKPGGFDLAWAITPAELPPGVTIGDTAWLSFVVVSPSAADDKRIVPLLLIRLLARPRENFLGGSFSSTSKDILSKLGTYVAELFPGLLFQEKIEAITERMPGLQIKMLDRLARTELLLKEREFAQLIKDVLPVIETVIIADRQKKKDEYVTTFRDIGGSVVAGSDDFRWSLPSTAQITQMRQLIVVGPPQLGSRESVDVTLYPMADRTYGLRCFLSRPVLATYEMRVLETIIAELRFAAFATLDVNEKTVQIAEIRHALRAGLTGLLGHLRTVTTVFDQARQFYRDNQPDIAMRRMFEEASFRKSLARARSSGEEMNAFFEDARVLLTDMNKASLQKSQVNVAQLLKELHDVLLPELVRRHIEIHNNCSPNISMICDRMLVRLALFNLLDNAIKYSYAPNAIDVTATERSAFVDIRIRNIGPHIELAMIRDTIFEQFQRVTYSGIQAMPGTGIGLPVTKKIAEVHGGAVLVESDLLDRLGGTTRATTTFTLRIPRG